MSFRIAIHPSYGVGRSWTSQDPPEPHPSSHPSIPGRALTELLKASKIMYSFVAVLAAGSALSNLAVYASRLTPPVVPLTVRNPYLSTWLSDARDPPWTQWPMFWTGERVRY